MNSSSPKPPEAITTAGLAKFELTSGSYGECALRVGSAINLVHGKLQNIDNTPINVIDCSYDQSKTLSAIKLSEFGEAACLVGTESGEVGRVTQNIYYVDKASLQAIPLFSLVEADSTERCSYSIFLPALAQNDLDWSVVAIANDETRAFSPNEVLKDVPQTNAIVLDMLLGVLKGKSAEELAKVLQIDELRRCYMRVSSELQRVKLDETNFLKKRIGDIATWLAFQAGAQHVALGEIQDNVRYEFTQKSGVDAIGVSATHLAIGNAGRIVDLGFLMPLETGGLSVLDANLQPRNKGSSQLIIAEARKAYDVPEVVNDPEVTKELDCLLRNLKNNPEGLEEFNDKVKQMVEDWRQNQNNSGEAQKLLNLGNINISDLPGGDYFSELSNIIVKIQANRQQRVLESCRDLYGCEVSGARAAFEKASGSSLLAEDCMMAFYEAGVIDSVANKVMMAFHEAIGVGCLAQNCWSAFFRIPYQEESFNESYLAVNCTKAFIRAPKRSNNTSQYCYRAFGNKKDYRVTEIDQQDWRSPISRYRAIKAGFVRLPKVSDWEY